MFSDARRAKKDVLADLVTLKHDVQTCITSASLRKGLLTSSENDVKCDMKAITEKLQRLLTTVHENARSEVSKLVKETQDKVNDEILYLEELHKR